jgi:hypothetical protein
VNPYAGRLAVRMGEGVVKALDQRLAKLGRGPSASGKSV